MADYITSIRTTKGDKQYDYDALGNKPESDTTLSGAGRFADAQVVGNKIKLLETRINNFNVDLSGYYTKTETDDAIKTAINGKIYYGTSEPAGWSNGDIWLKPVE